MGGQSRLPGFSPAESEACGLFSLHSGAAATADVCGGGAVASSGRARRATAWDYPLCRGEKIERLIHLFQTEVEMSHREVHALKTQQKELRATSGAASESDDETDADEDDGEVSPASAGAEPAKLPVANLPLPARALEAPSMAHEDIRSRMSGASRARSRSRSPPPLPLDAVDADEAGATSAGGGAPSAEKGAGGAAPSREGFGGGFDEGEASPKVPKVLIAIDLDLGHTVASLTVAPWQASSDYPDVVRDFLAEQGVRPIFVDTLVSYLEEVDANATTFPVQASAVLSELHLRYG